jgi:hypothetical protein
MSGTKHRMVSALTAIILLSPVVVGAQDQDHGSKSLKGLEQLNVAIKIDGDNPGNVVQQDLADLVKNTINDKLNTDKVRLSMTSTAPNPIMLRVRVVLQRQAIDPKNPAVFGYRIVVTTAVNQGVKITTQPKGLGIVPPVVIPQTIDTNADTWRMDGIDLGWPKDLPDKVRNLITGELSQFAIEWFRGQ